MFKKIVKNLEPSSTLKINEISKELEDSGKEIFKFGFSVHLGIMMTEIEHRLDVFILAFFLSSCIVWSSDELI